MLILNNTQKRRVTSSLFLTVAVGAVLSVAAPIIVPCPVERRAFLEEDGERNKTYKKGDADACAAKNSETLRRVEVVVRGRNSAGSPRAAPYPSSHLRAVHPEPRTAVSAVKDPDKALVDEPSAAAAPIAAP